MQITKRIYSNLDLRKQKLENYGGVVSISGITEATAQPIEFDISWEFMGVDITDGVGDITIKLPSEELLFVGKRIEITDIGKNAYYNNIYINSNGVGINGYVGVDDEVGKDAVINTNNGSIILRYVNENYGWRVIGFVN